MSNKVDLHIHSACSDGTDTPKQIIDKAKSFSMECISITDHDTIAAQKEAKEYAKKVGIQYVTGLELSAYSITEVHVLGYNFNENDSQLIEKLNEFSLQRRERVEKILTTLEKYNIILDKEAFPKTESIGRLHVASALLEKGYVKNIPEAFDRYLGAHGCAYFPSKRITPFEAVKIIKEAGGIPVIAHPLRFLQSKKLEDLVEGLKNFGLGGIEVYYGTHDDQVKAKLYELAKKNRLISTGGTDYHGKNRSQELGSIEFNLDSFTKSKLGLK